MVSRKITLTQDRRLEISLRTERLVTIAERACGIKIVLVGQSEQRQGLWGPLKVVEKVQKAEGRHRRWEAGVTQWTGCLVFRGFIGPVPVAHVPFVFLRDSASVPHCYRRDAV